jgi:hypothetical protein
MKQIDFGFGLGLLPRLAGPKKLEEAAGSTGGAQRTAVEGGERMAGGSSTGVERIA